MAMALVQASGVPAGVRQAFSAHHVADRNNVPAGHHCDKDARVAPHCQPLAFVLEAIAGLDSFKIGGIHLEDVLLTVRIM